MAALKELLKHWPIHFSLYDAPIPEGFSIERLLTCAVVLTAIDGRRFVLKRRDGRRDIATVMVVLEQLAAQGLPTAPLIPTREGTYEVVWEGARYGLHAYLPGRVFKQHYTAGDGVDAAILQRAAAYSRGLARLHQGLASLSDVNHMPDMDLPGQLQG